MRVSQRQTVEVDREIIYNVPDDWLPSFYEFAAQNEFHITKKLSWEELFDEAEEYSKLEAVIHNFLDIRLLDQHILDTYVYSEDYLSCGDYYPY